MARVELKGVAKRWGDVTAVAPSQLALADGEFVAILGPSGCGKSTTLFMLAGIYAPSEGDILFDGARVNEVEARDRNVGIVFQSYALYPHMSVRRNIMFPLRFKRLPSQEAEARILDVARLVHVEELLERLPAQLSGGQQQRVALARALVKQPQLLLLDEPLSNLDAALRLAMRSEIKRLQRETGVTTILVTHDQVEATTMADRIVCMSRGRIEQVGSPDDLYDRPQSLFVAGFIGAPPINLLAGKVSGGALRVGELAFALDGAAPAETVLGLRPEAIRLGNGPIRAAVEDVEPMGRETLYLLASALGPVRVLEPGAQARLRRGEQTSLDFAPADALLFDAASERRLADVRLRPLA
jgi:inositol-phosphate transport system ATP-binding protein